MTTLLVTPWGTAIPLGAPGSTTTPHGPEEGGMMKFNDKPLIARVIHWRHPNGKWVVVQGPFPEAMYRSETRETAEKAARIMAADCYARPATTRQDQYAKVLAKDVLEIQSGENEWGTVAP